jgi:uncharacterized protein YlzI (FlbEa/FlbD family)
MIPIKEINGPTCWINPLHIERLEQKPVSDCKWMEDYSDELNGATHYTEIQTVHGREYVVNATVEELLELINPYLENPVHR